jgi:hypothetical protein
MIIKPGNYALLLFLLTSIVLISCGGGGDGVTVPIFEENESFSFEVTAGNHTQLNMQAVNGEITITAEPAATSVKITGIKRVLSKISAEDAKAHLQDLLVNSESLANEVLVETIQPKDTEERNYIIDYTITLPAYFMIQVASANGNVTLDSIENDVTVNMANAKVILMNIHGSALVTIANGTIESEVVLTLQGTIDLKAATGDIHLTIPVNTSATFSATTLFGSIDVSNLVLQNEVITSTSRSGTLGSGEGNISLGTIGNISVSGF